MQQPSYLLFLPEHAVRARIAQVSEAVTLSDPALKQHCKPLTTVRASRSTGSVYYEWDPAKSDRNRRKHGIDMKQPDTIHVTRKPGDESPVGETDWLLVGAMTEAELSAAAAEDPDALPLTPGESASMRRVSPVKLLRQRLGLTQVQFAKAYSIPIGTLRDWEQHRSKPDAPALALLMAIEREPETMARLLHQAA